ncbi:MAG: orotidine-5'-phosphate decarboxylase [Bacteroidetes bacterium]|jgi:orotidine-5'-phosphate decarboxylase|nr:orotidine-5'-phosphate decarboxylase [Bacteroidota bacterium]
MTFSEKLIDAVRSSNSTLCVGLDPVPDKIPTAVQKKSDDLEEQVYLYCKGVIESTKNHACAYKPNTAFFEALGESGWRALFRVRDEIPETKILITDAKRGDIGHTAERYCTAFFEQLNADALTVNPLMGVDTLDAYMNFPSKAIFVLTMTSNRGAADFLNRRFEGRLSLGEYIAEELQKKQKMGSTHLGMVVGATQPQSIIPVLKASPASHLLIPGVGAQGGSTELLLKALEGHQGIPLVSSSRTIIYAGRDQKNWQDSVEKMAKEIKQQLQKITDRYAG